MLELASGTGEHAVHFAGRFPDLDWQPSDPDPGALESIAAWRVESGLANVRAPLRIDTSAFDWPVERADAVLSINMIHISPWTAALGLLDGAALLLPIGAPLILYGPWMESGVEPAPSNLVFDENLRARDSAWGLREVETFAVKAEARGLILVDRRSMPANNLMLLFRRS